MKEQKSKIAIFIVSLIILIGIIIIATVGFRVSLKYQESKKIEVNLGKKFELEDIKKIAQKELDSKVLIQKVEIYEDAVSIISKEINEEQKNEIINKINEKYELKVEKDNIKIEEVPHARLGDLVRPYVTPVIVMTIIILIYMISRYYKLNSGVVLAKTILAVGIGQALLFSILAIVRIEIGKMTVPIAIIVYILSLIYCTKMFEEELEEIKKLEEK